MASEWADLRAKQARINAFLIGGIIGIGAALILAAALSSIVDGRNESLTQRRISMIRAEASADAEECKRVVRVLSGEEYSAVLSLYRQTPEGRR